MGSAYRIQLAVALGSALGAVARYLCTVAAIGVLGDHFPWGTLSVNGIGSFLIGYFATVMQPDGRLRVRPETQQFVLGGFCGGFTTFSIFSLETLILVEAGATGQAALYTAVSIAVWIFAVWAGFRLGQRWRSRG